MLPTAPAINVVSTVFSAIERDDWATVADHTAPPAIERARRHDLAHVLAWAEYVATYAQGEKQGYGSGGTIKPELLARYGGVKLEWMQGTPTIHRHPEPEAAPTVIRSVVEDDDIAHVLYRRQDMQYDESARVDLITLRRDEGGWRLELNAFGMRSPLDDGDIMLAWRAVFWRSVLHAFKAWLKRVIGRARAQQP